jgi:hypothetical protein
MIAETTRRVEQNSPRWLNESLRDQATRSVARYESASPEEIERRLAELKREWDIERSIEVESAMMILLGLLLGASFGRKWLVLPFVAGAMLILHNTQGFYPLLPLFRRLGIRSAREIAIERYGLKALRGDFRNVENSPDAQDAIVAAKT